MRSKAVTLIENIVALFIIGLVLLWFIFVGLLHLTDPGQSNESAAIGNLRTVADPAMSSQNAFKYAEGGYAGSWKELRDDLVAAGKIPYLDIDLSVVVQGYTYTLKPAGDSLTGTNGKTVYTDFSCTAIPVKYEKGSKRSFFVDSTGVIRFEYGKTATIESGPI